MKNIYEILKDYGLEIPEEKSPGRRTTAPKTSTTKR